MRKIAKTKEETAKIAKIFLEKILQKKQARGARVVGLSGDLGAGKTAFVKAVAKHLSVKGTVNSPTFVIIKRYPIKKRGEHKNLFHLDAYRLKGESELVMLGWQEILKDKENLVFIEWPERVAKAMPKGARQIHIAHEKGTHRILKLK